jgi:hypothetical protein
MLKEKEGGRVVTGRGDSPLDWLHGQLWRGPVDAGSARLVIDPEPSPLWEDVEDYWVVPSPERARILIPRGPSVVTSAAFLSYRGLRSNRVNAARTLLGAVARLGMPPALHRVAVQRRVAAQAPAGGRTAALPLEALAATLGQDRLYAAIGIRLGDNRKPTLQLFTPAGLPAGYAKLAWDEASAKAITAESAALAEVGGGTGPMRAPRLIGTGHWQGFPYLITEPLPSRVRAVRGRVRVPTPQELFALSPVNRTDSLCSTAHYAALTRRVEALGGSGDHGLADAAAGLAALLAERNAKVAVAARWHGDLVPWNTAREPGGQLWCWDWESSERDAAAGLDALHWMLNVRRQAEGATPAELLMPALADAGPFLRAAGTPLAAWADVAGVYSLAVAERAWSLALRNGGWSAASISRGEVLALLARASSAVSEPRVQPPL